MNESSRLVITLAALLIVLATIFGAVGSHALQRQLSATHLATYEIAVRYQFFHALGLLAIGMVMRGGNDKLIKAGASLVLCGIVLFSGSLYALALDAPRSLGFVTPLGGLLLVGGWLAFALGVWRSR